MKDLIEQWIEEIIERRHHGRGIVKLSLSEGELEDLQRGVAMEVAERMNQWWAGRFEHQRELLKIAKLMPKNFYFKGETL